MISGHIATTLVAKRHLPEAPWWLLLTSAYGLDLLMFSLVAAGIETMENTSDSAGPTMAGAIIDMTYSHDLLPVLGWTLLAGLVVWAASRSRALVLACTALFFGHWLCDLVSGYGHFVFGPASAAIGTDWYHLNFMAAVVSESAFGILCVLLATVRTDQSTARRAALLLGFGLAPFSMLLY